MEQNEINALKARVFDAETNYAQLDRTVGQFLFALAEQLEIPQEQRTNLNAYLEAVAKLKGADGVSGELVDATE